MYRYIHLVMTSSALGYLTRSLDVFCTLKFCIIGGAQGVLQVICHIIRAATTCAFMARMRLILGEMHNRRSIVSIKTTHILMENSRGGNSYQPLAIVFVPVILCAWKYPTF